MGCGTCGGRPTPPKKASVSSKSIPKTNRRVITTHSVFGSFTVRPPRRDRSTRTPLKK